MSALLQLAEKSVGLNETCGGFLGIPCTAPLKCVLDDPKVADSQGKCQAGNVSKLGDRCSEQIPCFDPTMDLVCNYQNQTVGVCEVKPTPRPTGTTTTTNTVTATATTTSVTAVAPSPSVTAAAMKASALLAVTAAVFMLL